jgi:hypothetical protein
MKPNVVIALTAGLLVAAGRGKEEKSELPRGPAPIHTVARVDRAGRLIVTTPVTVYKMEERKRVVNRGGKEVEVTEFVRVPEVVLTTREVKNSQFQVFEAGGKKVEAKDLARRLTRWTPVLLSADGKKVDPFYLQVIKKGTPIILLPPETQRMPEPIPAPRRPVKPKNR